MTPRALIAFAAAALAAGLGVRAGAEEPGLVVFGGEDYRIVHRDVHAEGNSLVEFVREGEKIERWSKLVAFHRFPDTAASPKDAALGLANELKRREAGAKYTIIENPETEEVIIDFLASQSKPELVELNVFKYGWHASGRGLVAFQFAQRFKATDAAGAVAKKARGSAIDEAAAFDLAAAEPYLAPVAEASRQGH
jgi:hypothetical protein